MVLWHQGQRDLETLALISEVRWLASAGLVGVKYWVWKCFWKSFLYYLTFILFFSVYSSDVIDKQNASMTSGNTDEKAVIILVPVRLGGERTNTDYLEFVKVWKKCSVFKGNTKWCEKVQFAVVFLLK